MILREATIKDIKQLHAIRMAVKENALSNPLLVKEEDYANYLTVHGKGWLCEMENEIAGFAIVDTERNNVWALFVKPGFEQKGIGKTLHDQMLNWFFHNKANDLWLGTASKTRAERFYKAAGWKEAGRRSNGEVKFEMTYSEWMKLSKI